MNKTEIHSIHNGKDDTHLDKDSSSRKKSTRKSSVHSDSDEYVPHRRKSSHKVLSAFIGPKNGKN